MNNLLIIAPGAHRLPRDEQRRREMADESPRITFFDDALASLVIDGPYLRSIGGLRSRIYRRLPAGLVQALEAYRLRSDYDCVICWYDPAALAYALILTLTRARSPHVVITAWLSRRKRFWARLLRSRIDRIVVFSPVLRELAIDFFGFAPAELVYIPHFVDDRFWRPMDGLGDWICAVGNSQRDYATLIQAMDGLSMTCRIVTSAQLAPTSKDFGVTARTLEMSDAPANVVIGPASPTELRAIYSRSRFVVLPLSPSFGNFGITVAAEAMAMGKAIVCSRTYGMVDVIGDGVNGRFVPPGDASALRKAIQDLWDDPESSERMGAEGRRRAESTHALERFTASVQEVVSEVIRRAR